MVFNVVKVLRSSVCSPLGVVGSVIWMYKSVIAVNCQSYILEGVLFIIYCLHSLSFTLKEKCKDFGSEKEEMTRISSGL